MEAQTDNIKLLYIDLFCGAGGTSTGVEHAILNGKKCAKVIACINHDANAIASHAANHPDALHFTEDIRTLNLSGLIKHTNNMRKIYPHAQLVLWASLECTNFSKAKGGKPRDADSRTLAEHLFRYIEALRPDYIQIENVKEFMSWGDMDENGHHISKDKGKSYVRWVNNVCKYGYYFDWRILNAADYGAYTSRKRFFGQFALHGLPIAFPKATHAKCPAKYDNSLFSDENMKIWKPVREVLDLNDEGESIFNRKKPLVEKTLERIYAGLIKFVAGADTDEYSMYKTAPELTEAIKACPSQNTKVELPSYRWPDTVVRVSTLQTIANGGGHFEVRRDEGFCHRSPVQGREAFGDCIVLYSQAQAQARQKVLEARTITLQLKPEVEARRQRGQSRNYEDLT